MKVNVEANIEIILFFFLYQWLNDIEKLTCAFVKELIDLIYYMSIVVHNNCKLHDFRSATIITLPLDVQFVDIDQ